MSCTLIETANNPRRLSSANCTVRKEREMATDKRRNRAGGAKKTTLRKKNPKPTPSPPLTISDDEFYARVARKAYDLYQQRGEEPGRDLDDWLTAERLVKDELLHGPESEEPPLEEP
jgi:hypothetical protein